MQTPLTVSRTDIVIHCEHTYTTGEEDLDVQPDVPAPPSHATRSQLRSNIKEHWLRVCASEGAQGNACSEGDRVQRVCCRPQGAGIAKHIRLQVLNVRSWLSDRVENGHAQAYRRVDHTQWHGPPMHAMGTFNVAEI